MRFSMPRPLRQYTPWEIISPPGLFGYGPEWNMVKIQGHALNFFGSCTQDPSKNTFKCEQ